MKTQTLYFKEGSADKQYTATLDGKTVQCAWGRRGGTMQSKTYGPFSPAEAEAFYLDKLKEKTAKGYQPGRDATPLVVAAAPATVTTIPERKYLPMLLNEISEQELLAIIFSEEWALETKWDGVRCLLHKTRGTVIGLSRTQKPIALPQPVVDAAVATCHDNFVADGELVGDVFHVFDILSHNGRDLRPLTNDARRAICEEHWGTSHTGIVLTDRETDAQKKFDRFHGLKGSGAEGIVLKKRDAGYQTLRPGSGGVALKFKFVATASVIVGAKINGTTQAARKRMASRSVEMVLFDGTRVGSVTVPPNKECPPVGAVIDVRYLYLHSEGGSLVQAVYLGVREDIKPKACVASQFKIKNTPQGEE